MLLSIFALILSQAFADDQWLCTSQASRLEGSVLQVCGMGRGMNEETARMSALEDARLEFSEFCKMGDDCVAKVISVAPGRTTCEMDKKMRGVSVCFRLFTYTLTKR